MTKLVEKSNVMFVSFLVYIFLIVGLIGCDSTVQSGLTRVELISKLTYLKGEYGNCYAILGTFAAGHAYVINSITTVDCKSIPADRFSN